MVKGISRQVIVVRPPEPRIFEQAIFILKEDAVKEGVSDDFLFKEAQQAIHSNSIPSRYKFTYFGAFWAGIGASIIGILWAVSVLL